MRISWGYTRVVLLAGRYAVKVPRPTFTRLIGAFWNHFKNGTLRDVLRKHDGKLLKQTAFILRVHGGVEANREEARFYEKHADLPLAPVRMLLFKGLVLIQDRGIPASERERLQWLPSRVAARGVPVHDDLVCPDHICVLNRAVCLIDYGNEESRQVLVDLFAAAT